MTHTIGPVHLIFKQTAPHGQTIIVGPVVLEEDETIDGVTVYNVRDLEEGKS